ncbi:Rho GTPase effector BNI1 and related formins [Plasmopara halstedii]|uniref:Rho GTPase effector BNI1 and related formins n=1 Tax=Plasmopara halstedii TaxID=4781 RepID=A0A0P1B462_PLAHL|nr:Rho GTPase effector BNI1 and related formins [Plasmopara halstedii]CEG48202.1 Rho GTPase effector BNI1 and related formins [Plasmopara halstedii]|eukprot:XP_024584571.1 Rho GTPase effector BNI1 and related formins [Plasmopara halstedii]
MAPSFISMLMGAEKRSTLVDTINVPPQPNVALPNVGRTHAESLSFLHGFQRPPLGQPQLKLTTVQWNDKQKVHEFFRHTSRKNESNSQLIPTDHKTIDLTRHSRASSVTSISSSEDNQDDVQNVIQTQRVLDILQEASECIESKQNRRRYDSFDILADVRVSEVDDYDSNFSFSPRSRTNSEDYYGLGLLDMLSQRHIPVGLHHQSSVADMLGNHEIDPDEQYRERPALCGLAALLETHTVLADLAAQSCDDNDQSDNIEHSTTTECNVGNIPCSMSIVSPEKDEDEQSKSIDSDYEMLLKEYELKHGKYVQMLKVGLPQPVVEHKMRMDGVDPLWLHGPPQRQIVKEKQVEITDEERAAHREKYHKYFQMLRLGLPRGAVEQKMRMAGIDPIELNGPQQQQCHDKPKPVLKRKDSIRKKLHWEGKKHRPRRDSLWGGDAVEAAKEAVQISDESRAMLEQLFVKDLSASPKDSRKIKSERSEKKNKVLTALIDMKKSQNIAITLARIKVSFPELRRELLALNTTILSPSQVRSLMDMWPDRKEMEMLDNFRGDVTTLGTAEQFLLEVQSIPRFHDKLHCLVFKQEFPSRVQELQTSLSLVIQGVNQVCSSTALRQVLIYILQIGNLLNFGGDDDQGVNAFSLNSLVKLSQTKAFVGGITFLQYVVQSIERDVPHLATFYQDIDVITKCSKVHYASLISEKKALETGLEKLMEEAQASKLDNTMDEFQATLSSFCNDVKIQLATLQCQFQELQAVKAHFLTYFEEEETEEELDVLLSYIANFTHEYCREHRTFQAQIKTKRCRDENGKESSSKA